MILTHLDLSLPPWVEGWLNQNNLPPLKTEEQRMKFVIDLARQNVEQKTGGPFGAAIFEQESGRLVSVGVNRVVPENCSVAHAEMMAFMLAQKRLKAFDLGGVERCDHELVTSSQMCSMCFGAIPWSGVRRVVCGATGQDVENIVGFDEGPIHPNWCHELEKRGIQVTQEILREEACEVLRLYTQMNGTVYNGRSSG